jgi:GT2 family glycosyltransferase
MRSKIQNVLGAYRHLPFGMKHSVRRAINAMRPHLSYSRWIRHCEKRVDARRAAIEIASFAWRPKVSIVMPVYNTPIDLLDLAIGSVERQFYGDWELCICDDASANAEVPERLSYWAAKDSRIKVTHSERNEGIAIASNRALALATGEFVGLVDHDDELTEDALFEVVKLLQTYPDADIIYSDEDMLDPQGQRVNPFFKPDWSPERMLSYMYTSHLTVYTKRRVDEVGGFRPESTGCQDYDLLFRISEKAERIYHIPRILYHWRVVPTSVAASAGTKPYAFIAAKNAIREHLNRKGLTCDVVDRDSPGSYRVRFRIDEGEKVSILVLSLNGKEKVKNCIESVKAKTSYGNRETIAVHFENGSRNLSAAISQAAKRANGKYIVFLHDDTEVISPDWVQEMLGFCQQEEIGAVGARLLYRSGRIQHAGAALGVRGVLGHPLRNCYRDSLAYPDAGRVVRNCSAVSSGCMAVRKEVFETLGGFDERFSGVLADADFCLRLLEANYRIVWTPDAELFHDDTDALGVASVEESALFKERWERAVVHDRYYNPNLTTDYEDMGYRVKRL